MLFREIREVKPIIINSFQSNAITRNSEDYKNQYSYKMMLFTEGNAQVEAGEFACLCHPNDIVFLPPGERYRVLNTGDFSVINLYFSFAGQCPHPYTFDRSFQKNLAVPRIGFEDAPLFSEAFVFSFPYAREYFSELMMLYNSHSDLFPLMGSTMILHIMAKMAIGRHSPEGPEAPLINHIVNHCEEALSAETLAKQYNYHPSSINRMIRRKTGQSFHEFLIEKRIERAILYLQETTMSVTEIAHSLSFYDSAHFINVFRKKTGVTPLKYRQAAEHPQRPLLRKRV